MHHDGPNCTTFHKCVNKDSLQNECDVLEKAVQLYIFVHPNKESHLLEEYRSRYSKFRTYQYEHKPHVVTRDRDPSRLPVKQLTRVMHKSKKIRKRVRNYVAQNVSTSRVHCFANKCNFNHEQVKLSSQKLSSKKASFTQTKENAKLYYPSFLTSNSRIQKCAAVSLSHVYQGSQPHYQSPYVHLKKRCRKKILGHTQ